MKREKIAAFPMALAMACALSIGAMGSMISGLDLPVENMEPLYTAFGVTALAGCVIFLFKKGWIAALVLAAAAIAWLWQDQYLSLPLRALITRLSWIYDSAYGWGMLEFAGVHWRSVPLDLPLGVWGCCVALSASRTMMQGRWLGLTLALALLPVGATMVVTNTVPEPFFLYLTMLGVILMLLTATVRRQNPGQGAVLTAMTALPIALLLGVLFHFCPKDTYVNRSEEYLDQVVSWWQNSTTLSFDNTGLVDRVPAAPNASATANLSRVGPRNNWGYTVMEVTADYSGTVYLRGQDFNSYSGGSWTAAEDRAETFGAPADHGAWTYDGEITIRTATASNVLYLPYYPADPQPLDGGRMENTSNLRAYSFGVRHPLSTTPDRDSGYTLEVGTASQPAGSGTDPAVQRCTQLPSDTRRWALAYLNEHFTSSLLNQSPDYEVARAIASHVRASAVYDTNTPRMPGDYDDFVQWFLEESDTGYCVHFASAATVLLRAAGVPARYVTGYMFQAEEGGTVEVTADQAHAWVEYYHEGLNAWVVLEATPADLSDPEETDPPATRPEETEPATEPPTDEEGETRPDTEAPGNEQPEEKADLTWLRTAVQWLLRAVLLWLAVVGQYVLRRHFRRPRRHPNARALGYWTDAENLCRFTGQTPPEELEALAQKAKFSQHTLTAEELNVFRAWLKDQRQKLKQAPWYRRFVYKYVLALW